MSERPVPPNAATLPLPPEWLRFFVALLAYVDALEARVQALEEP